MATQDLLTKHLYGENIRITNIEEGENFDTIYLKSVSKSCACPYCGETSTHMHSTKKRYIQDVYIRKATNLVLNAHQFDCENPDCSTKVFNETFDFVDISQRRTIALNQMILVLSYNFSFKGASEILNEMGYKITGMAIANMLKHIQIIDDENIERIGVDDASRLKGREYFTTIYDLDTHRAIALLNGRDGEELKKWLSGHQKVKIVARDRCATYAKAIREALPNCIQIADKFHIMHNLLMAITEIIKEDVPYYVYARDGKIIRKEEKNINSEKFTNSPIFDPITGEHIECFGSFRQSKKFEQLKKNDCRFKKPYNFRKQVSQTLT
jgi:transposase